MAIDRIAGSEVFRTALRITHILERWKNSVYRSALEAKIFLDIVVHGSRIVFEVIGLVADTHMQQFCRGKRVVEIEALHASRDECADRRSNRFGQTVGAAE